MSNGIQSIEDLLGRKSTAPSKAGEETTQEKFSAKMSGIAQDAKEKETAAQAAALGLPYIDLRHTMIDREALPLLSKEEMVDLQAAVFLHQNGQLRLATTNPNEAVTAKMQELAHLHNAKPALYLISQASMQKALAEHAKIPKKIKVSRDVIISAADLEKYKNEAADLKGLPAKLRDIPLSDVRHGENHLK